MIHAKVQRLCVWSGPLCVTLFFLALIISNFFPLPSPSLTQDEVLAMYKENTVGIRIGMVLMLISGGFGAPFVAVISIQLRRIERGTPVMSYTQLCTGAFGLLFFSVPAIFFLITAYRLDRPPELTYLMNDVSWFFTMIGFPPFFIQYFAIALAILGDKSKQPLFPRWIGFFNIWVAIFGVAAVFIPFFKSGPFAWNGLFVFWVPAVLFGAWYFVTVRMLLKGIEYQEKEQVA